MVRPSALVIRGMFRRGLLRTLLNYFGTTTRVVPLFANIWPNNTRVHSGPLDAREECKAGQLENWRLEDRMKEFDGDPHEVEKDRGRKEPVKFQMCGHSLVLKSTGSTQKQKRFVEEIEVRSLRNTVCNAQQVKLVKKLMARQSWLGWSAA